MTGSTVAGRVATDRAVPHLQQRSIVVDATAAAGLTDEATRISAASVIVADGTVRQSQCSLIYKYAGAAAGGAVIRDTCEVIGDGDFVEDHGSKLTRKKIATSPHAAAITTVATAWSATSIAGVISANGDVRECHRSRREIDSSAATT